MTSINESLVTDMNLIQRQFHHTHTHTPAPLFTGDSPDITFRPLEHRVNPKKHTQTLPDCIKLAGVFFFLYG